MPTPQEFAETAAQLKARIQEARNRLMDAGVPAGLQTDLSETLDQIIDLAMAGGSSGDASDQTDSGHPTHRDGDAEPSPTRLSPLIEQTLLGSLASVMEESLKLWQTDFSHSVSQLNEVFPAVQGSLASVVRLHQDLEQRIQSMEQLRQQLAGQLDRNQALELRLSRQRKALAQSIRAQRAELKLKVLKAQADLDSQLAKAMEAEWQRFETEKSELSLKLQSAEDQLATLAKRSAESEMLDQKLQEALEENQSLRNQLSEALQARQESTSPEQQHAIQTELNASKAKLDQSERELGEIQEKLAATTRRLEEKEHLLNEQGKRLDGAVELQNQTTGQIEELLQQLNSVNRQLDLKSELLEQAENQLASIESSRDSESNSSFKDQQAFEQMQSALEQAESEMADLRRQNSELAQKIAQHAATAAKSPSAKGPVSQETLSWEERKKMILQQLEQETDSEGGVSQEQRVEIERIVETTQNEILRRDREIEELRAIVQTQSDAREGVAIGAAGLAQILDSDELINAERQKLKEIQEEWQAKLRQAEIDLSMERAKLARERAELDLQKSQIPQAESAPAGTEKQRRWLDYLGLKEESGE